MTLSDYVVMITPKAVLNTPEFRKTRDLLATKKIDCIQDYGENGFKGVLVETICLFVDTNEKPNETKVESLTLKKTVIQSRSILQIRNIHTGLFIEMIFLMVFLKDLILISLRYSEIDRLPIPIQLRIKAKIV